MRFIFASLLCLTFATPVLAAQAPSKPFTVSGELGVVSDYRFRGLSLSNEDPALQGGLTLNHKSGAYAGVWASTIADYGGANVELDGTVGWSGDVAGLTVDVAAAHYGYPGGQSVAYWEIPVSVSKTFGPATVAAQYAYAPEQSNLGGLDNRYGSLDLTWTAKVLPVDLGLHVGQEKGAFAPSAKTDWSVSAAHAFGPVKASLAYVGAHATGLSDSTVVAALTAGF